MRLHSGKDAKIVWEGEFKKEAQNDDK
ncbi:hypothetical protein CCP3SC15_150029 [Gammaproteobacteria bacterium]